MTLHGAYLWTKWQINTILSFWKEKWVLFNTPAPNETMPNYNIHTRMLPYWLRLTLSAYSRLLAKTLDELRRASSSIALRTTRDGAAPSSGWASWRPACYKHRAENRGFRKYSRHSRMLSFPPQLWFHFYVDKWFYFEKVRKLNFSDRIYMPLCRIKVRWIGVIIKEDYSNPSLYHGSSFATSRFFGGEYIIGDFYDFSRT